MDVLSLYQLFPKNSIVTLPRALLRYNYGHLHAPVLYQLHDPIGKKKEIGPFELVLRYSFLHCRYGDAAFATHVNNRLLSISSVPSVGLLWVCFYWLFFSWLCSTFSCLFICLVIFFLLCARYCTWILKYKFYVYICMDVCV